MERLDLGCDFWALALWTCCQMEVHTASCDRLFLSTVRGPRALDRSTALWAARETKVSWSSSLNLRWTMRWTWLIEEEWVPLPPEASVQQWQLCDSRMALACAGIKGVGRSSCLSTWRLLFQPWDCPGWRAVGQCLPKPPSVSVKSKLRIFTVIYIILWTLVLG